MKLAWMLSTLTIGAHAHESAAGHSHGGDVGGWVLLALATGLLWWARRK